MPLAGSLLCACGVEGTLGWVCTQGLHDMESGGSGDLELLCNEAGLSRGREVDIHIISPLFFFSNAQLRLFKKKGADSA